MLYLKDNPFGPNRNETLTLYNMIFSQEVVSVYAKIYSEDLSVRAAKRVSNVVTLMQVRKGCISWLHSMHVRMTQLACQKISLCVVSLTSIGGQT